MRLYPNVSKTFKVWRASSSKIESKLLHFGIVIHFLDLNFIFRGEHLLIAWGTLSVPGAVSWNRCVDNFWCNQTKRHISLKKNYNYPIHKHIYHHQNITGCMHQKKMRKIHQNVFSTILSFKQKTGYAQKLLYTLTTKFWVWLSLWYLIGLYKITEINTLVTIVSSIYRYCMYSLVSNLWLSNNCCNP